MSFWCVFVFFKQKPAYEMRISDWSSDVCSSDLKLDGGYGNDTLFGFAGDDYLQGSAGDDRLDGGDGNDQISGNGGRDVILGGAGDDRLFGEADEIGRASCRERVWQYV